MKIMNILVIQISWIHRPKNEKTSIRQYGIIQLETNACQKLSELLATRHEEKNVLQKETYVIFFTEKGKKISNHYLNMKKYFLYSCKELKLLKAMCGPQYDNKQRSIRDTCYSIIQISLMQFQLLTVYLKRKTWTNKNCIRFTHVRGIQRGHVCGSDVIVRLL